MKAACSTCGAQHSLPDAQLVGRPRVQFFCAKCGKTTLVEVAQNPDATQVLSPLPDFARSAGAPRLARGGVADALTTEQIDALKTDSPEWLQQERATQAEVRKEAVRLKEKNAEPRRPRS